MPQLGLQQVKPGGQMLSPHGIQAMAESQPVDSHANPAGAHTPQLGSQQ